ncbi:MAG: lysophospholipid acyltransferase family protein [Nitrospiraceae bacterium]|nr:lysophospholipid acyltransferase family protein [Nitrospiraceae bacterium]
MSAATHRCVWYTFTIPMLFLRRAYKILFLILIQILFSILALAIHSVVFTGRERRMRLLTWGMTLWAKSVSSVLGLKIRTTGRRPEKAGVFIVANHSSYTDITVIGSILPAVFVSKAEVRSWPLFGALAKAGGTIFVNRETPRSTLAAIGEAGEELRAGANVVVFAEGTTDNGNQVDAFMSSFFRIPAEASAPVLPVSLYYSAVDGRPASDMPSNETAWYHMPLFTHFWNLLSKKRVDVLVLFNEIIEPDRAPHDRKALAALAEERVREGFAKLKGMPRK